MRATVKLDKGARDNAGREVHLLNASLNDGRVKVVLHPGESQEYDLTGDQIGMLRGYGATVEYAEEKAGPPKGSKIWLLQQAAKKAGETYGGPVPEDERPKEPPAPPAGTGRRRGGDA